MWNERHASADEAVPDLPSDEEVVAGECPQNIQLKWMTEVSSSVYSTPLITDLYSDGQKEVVVPSFVHYLEVLEGANGAKAADWSAFHKSTVHTSPLKFDFDFDGVQDILLATYDGEILAFKDNSELLAERLLVPRLQVRKDWFKGLNPDPIDHSHPDIGDEDKPVQGSGQDQPEPNLQQGAKGGDAEKTARRRGRSLMVIGDPQQNPQAQQQQTEQQTEQRAEQVAGADNAATVSQEGADSFKELFQDDDEASGGRADDVAAVLPSSDDHYGDYNEHRWKYDDYMAMMGHDDFGRDRPPQWDDEAFWNREAGPVEPEMVYLDPHIMCTPAIADIDGDGQDELVVAVSYFFDREYYDDPEHQGELPKDVDTSNYIAGGVVVFNLRTRLVKWSQHLDLSTDHTQFRAYLYSAPTLADINRDGKLEIILGTSMGFLYVLDCEGKTLPGWPLQMGEIQGQVAVGDINGDGNVELVALDARGNVAALSIDGKEVWERHVKSLLSQGAMLGDVNGDGKLEIVFGSSSGHLHVLAGETGADVKPFPFKTHGRIMAPVLITRLGERDQQHLIAMSYDGHLYAVGGITGCADVVDIGEASYGMVLADDLDGNGRMDLLVATMNGNVYCFETPAPYHALRAWTSQVHSHNTMVARDRWEGVHALEEVRRPRDVRGHTLPVRFEIVDNRPPAILWPPGQPKPAESENARGPYTVFVTLKGVGSEEMKAGDAPVIGMTDTYSKPGIYTLEIPCPKTRSTATIHIEMHDEHKMSFEDEFSLSFHMHFHRLLKWLVAVPLTAMAVAVLSMVHAPNVYESLPSFRTSL
ncbi:hypothetical protein WJX72_004192 [[Myrmecia] bisecta]|uniref:DEX1 C-terminal domain-containing protein n=1 Tax=[Myrmecia] bisecta TaxID=41462 RepID=A0AAW1QAC9_9CHLO